MNINKLTIYLILVLSFAGFIYGKKYKGAELRTRESFTYGRFEVRYIPAKREGVVSSFFTYHEISNTAQWNEIDFEFIGRYDNLIQCNVITQGQGNHEASVPLGFNPYAEFHTYAFEWTPDYIAWFVDGEEILRQTEDHIATVNRDQKIMMNIWPPSYLDWVGYLSDDLLPARAYYDWVSYSSYTPGSGDTGTENDFTLQWKDEFETYDSNRWAKATHTWNGNQSDFIVENVKFQDGLMILCLTEEGETGLDDSRPPVVLWAKENSRQQVIVRFSEEVDQSLAETTGNYIIPGVNIIKATLSDDKTFVWLDTENYDDEKTYNVIVQNVTDDEPVPNKMAAAAKTIIQLENREYPLKINVGGEATEDYIADKEWLPDGGYGYLDGSVSLYPGNLQISDTDIPEVFRSERHRMVTYRIDAPRGIYNVILQFAENYFTSAGNRLFDITIEDIKVADDLDVFEEAGKNSAFEISSEVFVDDDRIDIYFTNEVDYALLNGIIINQITTDVKTDQPVENDFRLNQNYPNPFNPKTKIEYSLRKRSFVSIKIYDVIGNELQTLVNEELDAGNHSANFNAASYSSGVFFYQLIADGILSDTKKMIYLK